MVLPKLETKGIGTRISDITTGSGEGGFIAATFDNVHVNGAPYDNFDSNDLTEKIDPLKWRTWEFVRAVSDGALVSALTQRGVNGSNSMSFVNSQAILGFEADLKVVEFQNSGARPFCRLYAALYNDGTGNSTPGDLKGDVIGSVGILEQGSGLQAFYAVSKCTAPDCNLLDEYEVLTSGIFGPVGLNETHRFSLSWNGSQLTFGFAGSPPVSYIPPVPVAGPPKYRKGIGTRVSEITNSDVWAYVSATFDNVVVLSMGYPLTVTKSGTGNGTVTSSPPGINCGSDCGEGYPSGTPVTLTATPGAGSTFQVGQGWMSGTGPCTVTMDAAKSVTATFTINTYTVTASVVNPTGGTVTPPLSQTVNYGGTATFTVTTNPGYTASVSEGTLAGSTWTIPNVTSTHTATVTFTIVSPPPTIISVTPNYGFVETVDNFYMINGTGFLSGATVKLTKGGQSDIIAAIDVITSTQIRGRISLSGADVGLWNVVITNPDSQSYALTNGFKVNPPGCPTPTTPSTPSPGNGATNRPTDQTLSWGTSADADSYEVYFGTSSNPPFLGQCGRHKLFSTYSES